MSLSLHQFVRPPCWYGGKIECKSLARMAKRPNQNVLKHDVALLTVSIRLGIGISEGV